MKNNMILEELDFVDGLSPVELTTIDGGGFWGDLFFVLGAAAHYVVYALQDAHNNPIRPSEYR